MPPFASLGAGSSAALGRQQPAAFSTPTALSRGGGSSAALLQSIPDLMRPGSWMSPFDMFPNANRWGGAGAVEGFLFDPSALSTFDALNFRLRELVDDYGNTWLVACSDSDGNPINDWKAIEGHDKYYCGPAEPAVDKLISLTNSIRGSNGITPLDSSNPLVTWGDTAIATFTSLKGAFLAEQQKPPQPASIIQAQPRTLDGLIYGVPFTIPSDFISDPRFDGKVLGVVDPVTRLAVFYGVPDWLRYRDTFDIGSLIKAIAKTVLALVAIVVGIIGILAGGAGIAVILAGVASIVSVWYDFSQQLEAKNKPPVETSDPNKLPQLGNIIGTLKGNDPFRGIAKGALQTPPVSAPPAPQPVTTKPGALGVPAWAVALGAAAVLLVVLSD